MGGSFVNFRKFIIQSGRACFSLRLTCRELPWFTTIERIHIVSLESTKLVSFRPRGLVGELSDSLGESNGDLLPGHDGLKRTLKSGRHRGVSNGNPAVCEISYNIRVHAAKRILTGERSKSTGDSQVTSAASKGDSSEHTVFSSRNALSPTTIINCAVWSVHVPTCL